MLCNNIAYIIKLKEIGFKNFEFTSTPTQTMYLKSKDTF